MRRLFISTLTALVACGTGSAQPTAEPVEVAPVVDAGGTAADVVSIPAAPRRRPGVAHTALIDLVALAADGGAAITRDQLGSLRLWPTLDGTTEPQIVPVRGANQFSVASSAAGGHVAFVTDGAGGARIVRFDAEGRPGATTELPPTDPVIEGHALADAEHFVVLFRDRSIRLLASDGSVVASIDERRFAPDRLMLAAGGERVVAVVDHPRQGVLSKVELVSIAIDVPNRTLARVGHPRLVGSENLLTAVNGGLDPSGERFAYFDKMEGNEFRVVVVELGSDQDPRVFTHALSGQNGFGLGLGFVDAHRVLITPGDGALGTLIDVDAGTMWARPGPPGDFNHQGRAQAVGLGRQIYAYGSWLYVHDVEPGAHRFLGYEAVTAPTLGLSPEGRNVAWGFTTGAVVVEPLAADEAGEPVELRLGEVSASPWRVRFVDEDQLLTLDNVGNVVLHRWRDGVEVARAGVLAGLRNADFDPVSGLLAVDRHHNDVRVFRVADDRIEGPWLVGDGATRFGLLGAKTPTDPVLWTMDGTYRMREYSEEQLRVQVDLGTIGTSGREMTTTDRPVPMAIGRDGRRFGMRWVESRQELTVELGERVVAKTVDGTDVMAIHVSPAGSRIAVASARAATVSIRDAESLDEQWVFGGTGEIMDVSWSQDGARLGLATQTGAVVLDAATGEIVGQRCGLDFEVSHAPPGLAFSSFSQRAVCER